MTTHTKAELMVLGVLEDSLGGRHRSTNGVTPDEAVGRTTLAEMLDLERHIDARVRDEREEAAAARANRLRWRRP
jgi:hypothetical protein